MNPIVTKHLQEARHALVEQRDALDSDIAQLDAMLSASGAQLGLPAQSASGATSRGPAPAMKDAIKDFLRAEDRDFSTNEVAVALQEMYGWKLSSTRSQIAKMGKDREVVSVRRGVYRARRSETSGPKYTSGPDVSGPEGDVTAAGQGGDSHAQADRYHDYRQELRDPDRDDRGGAPIGGPAL